MKKSVFVVAIIVALSPVALGQELTAREYAKNKGLQNRQTQITLGSPHACTLSKQHPCIYYGGDIDPNDPQMVSLANENVLPLLYPYSIWTYTEINIPVALTVRVSAAFTNNLQMYGVIDPHTANWDFRVGVFDEHGGTSIGSGTSSAMLTDTGRNISGLEEYELLTRTPVTLPTGNVWFDVQPNCTNSTDADCWNGGYFESDSDGLNSINNELTVTSDTGMGPTFYCTYGLCEVQTWVSWCTLSGLACGDGMSAGLLK